MLWRGYISGKYLTKLPNLINRLWLTSRICRMICNMKCKTEFHKPTKYAVYSGLVSLFESRILQSETLDFTAFLVIRNQQVIKKVIRHMFDYTSPKWNSGIWSSNSAFFIRFPFFQKHISRAGYKRHMRQKQGSQAKAARAVLIGS